MDLRAEWLLDVGVIEKDYALGWLLAGVANDPELATTWIFKGGTCLRKCYYETYRFSEDLDFTIVNGGPETPEELVAVFTRIASWLREEAGIEFVVDQGSFRRRRNLRGNPTTQGRLAYRGPMQPPMLPKAKLDLTSDEVLAGHAEMRQIVHPYSDASLPAEGILCYSLVELFAEKIRALAQRCRPRDLYDVVHMRRHPDLLDRAPVVLAALDQKCAHVGIAVPDLAAIQSSPFREEIEREWENMLGHQLPRPLPPFAEFWGALDDLFSWLKGERPQPLSRSDRPSAHSRWHLRVEDARWHVHHPARPEHEYRLPQAGASQSRTFGTSRSRGLKVPPATALRRHHTDCSLRDARGLGDEPLTRAQNTLPLVQLPTSSRARSR